MSRSPAPSRPLRRIAVVVLALVALGTAGCAAAPPTTSPVVVTTAGGPVQGLDDGTVARFQGIRYAQPPTGPLRWSLPVAAAPHADVVRAEVPGPRCPQAPDPGATDDGQSEDCLFLNVSTPHERTPGSPLPVMIWWHGGGLISGAGSVYDPRRLVEQGGIVVVTVNYRLGALGYLGLPGLAGSGSFGFADQLLSVRWVRENIAAFGGDPENITVAGQSAGGVSACALLTSPAASRLQVRRVGVMSGACSLSFPPGGFAPGSAARRFVAPVDQVRAAGAVAAKRLGCAGPDAVTCMRAKPVADLLPLGATVSQIAFGTDLLPRDPAVALGDAALPALPVIYGGTRRGTGVHETRRGAQPRRLRRRLLPAPGADGVRRRSGPGGRHVPDRRLRRIDGGRLVHRHHRRGLVVPDAARRAGPRRQDPDLRLRVQPTRHRGGAPHSGDLALLLDVNGRTIDGDSRADLGAVVVQYWSSFVRSGRPEAVDAPRWDALPAGAPPVHSRLGVAGIEPVDAYTDHHCALWDSLS